MVKIDYDAAKTYKSLQKQQKDTVSEFFKKKDDFAKKCFIFALACFILLGIIFLFIDSIATQGIFSFFAFISMFLI